MQIERNFEGIKVALVNDILSVDGGSQRVLRVLHDMFPEAPVYTSLYLPEKFHPPLDGWDIRMSAASRLPFSKGLEQQYKMLQPFAFELFDFSEYDLVISQTYAGFSKGIIVPPECTHVCYVETVPRFLWGYRTATHDRLPGIYKNFILPPIEHFWRIWDRQSAQRPDVLLANSQNTARRVKKHWRREAKVIYPPADVKKLLGMPGTKEKKLDQFMYFGRLEKYKCVDMAIRACVAASKRLVVVGTGTYETELQALVKRLEAEKLISFTGWIERDKLDKVIAQSESFIFPGVDEDFGLVMVEALAAGTPVIAFNAGGSAEIVENGVSGVLVDEISQTALNAAVKNFNREVFDPEKCRERAKLFSEEMFRTKLLSFLMNLIKKD